MFIEKAAATGPSSWGELGGMGEGWGAGQVIFNGCKGEKEALGSLPQLYEWNWAHVDTPYLMSEHITFNDPSSPFGWHSLPYYVDPVSVGFKPEHCQKFRNTMTTWGNNVFVHENWEEHNSWLSNYRPDASVDLAKKYVNASVTQRFYTSFQQHNFSRGGKESGAVIANVQDGSGYNNVSSHHRQLSTVLIGYFHSLRLTRCSTPD
ncbi:hypothetical protein BKA93DRAFT_826024 [Sparassis latifolia]